MSEALYRKLLVRLKATPLEVGPEPEWCDRCLLPSAHRVLVAIDFDGSPWCLRWVTYCVDCGVAR